MIENILKENITYTNDSWEKPLHSLTISLPLSVTAHRDSTETETLLRLRPRLRRRELSRYMSQEDKSIYRGYPNSYLTSTAFCKVLGDTFMFYKMLYQQLDQPGVFWRMGEVLDFITQIAKSKGWRRTCILLRWI